MDVVKRTKKPAIEPQFERWRNVPGIQQPREPKRFIRMAKKLNHYEFMGQYKEQTFYCKLGKPITEARVMQYENMCHKLVRQYLPSLALWEAGYVYEDLINMCKREIYLALLNGFDPVKALTTKETDPVKKAKIEKRKRENLDQTYINAEKSIVYGRISQFLRRERYKYHPDQLGGRTISREMLLFNVSRHKVQFREMEMGLCHQPNQMNLMSAETNEIKNDLLSVMEKEGVEKVRERFLTLDEDQKEELFDLLSNSNHADYLSQLDEGEV